jgi:hypothetical protein
VPDRVMHSGPPGRWPFSRPGERLRLWWRRLHGEQVYPGWQWTPGWRLGGWSRLLAPGYGWCGRCGTPWRFVRGHDTWYGPGDEAVEWSGALGPGRRWTATSRACFPLCERCWAELEPYERLPYYVHLVFEVWEDASAWPQIRAAVLDGG